MFEVQSRNSRSARWWFSQRDKIDMEPEYQRLGGIWSIEDQRFLIDSILNDYDLPKIYIADFTTIKSGLNTERKRFAVIDGKQRLEAIFAFLSNELSLSRKFVYEECADLSMAGLRYKDLEAVYPEVAAKVEEFPLSVMHVVTDEIERINELFVRLNKGASLTGAEKRNAMIGPIPKFIRRAGNHQFFTECVSYGTKRGQNLNAAAKLLLFEARDGIVDTKKADLDRLVSDYSEASASEVSVFYDAVVENLDRMTSIFGKNDELLRSQGNVPVFYLFIKNSKRKYDDQIRPFLTEFLAEIAENRHLPADQKDAELSDYELAARSTNDQSALEQRIEMLERRFDQYG